MKGIVFAEFLDLVEQKFGLEVADEIITNSNLPSKGAYTAIGTYEHTEILQLVTQLSQKTHIPIKDLVKVFGHHLLGVFFKKYAVFFKDQDTFGLLKSIDAYIHVEVRKLYPDAELPSFKFEEVSGKKLRLVYKSKRPFADLAEGLIEATIKHFQENIELTVEGNESATERTFILEKKA